MDWKDVLAGISVPEGEENNDAEPNQEAPQPKKPKGFGNIKVVEEKKGRKGKTATILYGFTCDDEELQQIAKRLKQSLGIGGSARGGEILLQGAVREKAMALLKELKIEN
jgi:translation initiation factor 1